MPASNYIEKLALEWTLVNKAPTLPGTKAYLALCESEVTKTMNGKEVSEAGKGGELNYTSYKRTEIKLEAATWKETAGGAGTATKYVNELAITLPTSTGTGSRQIAKFWALCEKKEGSETGNVFYTGKFTEELNITPAITKLEIEAGKLEISAE